MQLMFGCAATLVLPIAMPMHNCLIFVDVFVCYLFDICWCICLLFVWYLFGCAATGAAHRIAMPMHNWYLYVPTLPSRFGKFFFKYLQLSQACRKGVFCSVLFWNLSQKFWLRYEFDKYKFCGGAIVLVAEMQKAEDKTDMCLCYSFQGGADKRVLLTLYQYNINTIKGKLFSKKRLMLMLMLKMMTMIILKVVMQI